MDCLFYYNNPMENCEQRFDIEKTDSLEFTAVVFLNNEFIFIGHDAFNYLDKNDKNANKVYLFLKYNKLKKKVKNLENIVAVRKDLKSL
jgi:hypothetical protein